MSDPFCFLLFSSSLPLPKVLRLELAPVELDFGQLHLLLLEVAWIAEVNVQPILFMAILYWGYVFKFMYSDLVKMDIMYFDSGF